MNKYDYDFVPMRAKPEYWTGSFGTMTPKPKYPWDVQMSEHIEQMLTPIMLKRYPSKWDAMWAYPRVWGDDLAEKFKKSDSAHVRNTTFGVSELNQLLRDQYNSTQYDLAQAKNRAIENQNAVNSILGQVQGYSPNNITERILMSVMAGE